jgi:predicted RNase H-like HicB family nuclease
MEREFTAVIEKKGRWYVAFVEEIPGVNTQGRTLAEARRNLKEALSLMLETNRKLAARDRSPDARREPITLTMWAAFDEAPRAGITPAETRLRDSS